MSSELALKVQGTYEGRWKRYPAYKDSGVEWLGEVPVGWEVMKLKQFSKLITKGTTPMTIGKGFVNDGITFVKVENINNNFSIDTSNCNYIDEETDLLLNRSRLRDRDILIAIAGAIGRVAIVDRNILPANTNQAVGIIRLYNNLINEKFLLYFLGSANVNQFYILNTVQSAQANLSLGNISNIKLTYPPLHEQRAIAAFLDRETGRIDTLIEKKERQVELLQEKRAALISHVVTKGLDPDVKMKDSGVEWLGKVPDGWEVIGLRRLLDPVDGIKIGPFGSQLKSDIIQPTGFKVYGQENVIARNFDLGYRFVDENKFKELAVCEIISGDIVMTMMGTTGRCQIVPEDIQKGIMDSHLLRIRINEIIINPFFLEILIDEALYIKHQIRVGGKGSIMHGLNSSIIKSLSIVLPSLPEQYAIAAFLDCETGRIDTLTTKLRESTSKLREYRIALISAAVTGKIDVRQEAA